MGDASGPSDRLPQAPIVVERIDGPILTAAGDQDALWKSTTYVNQIEQRLTRRELPLRSPGADLSAGPSRRQQRDPVSAHPTNHAD